MQAIELFELNFRRAKELLETHRTAHKRGRPVTTGVPGDVLRSAIVFAAAALDAYIHKRITESVIRIIREEKRVPENCANNITKPFAEEKVRRELLNIAVSKKPSEKIIHLLESSLAGKTFQKPEQITQAFDMMELKDPWRRINQLVNLKRGPKKKGRKPDVRNFLLELSKRRDSIVHKGDIYVSKKYQGGVVSINRKDVKTGLDTLRKVIFAIEKISSN